MGWTILLVAHGTVEALEDLPAFMKEIRRGRPAPPALISEMEDRYRHVGGSPLLRHTEAQARALESLIGIPTRVAMRLWEPRVKDVLSDLGAEDKVCVLPLAPFSVDVYGAAAREELAQVADAPQMYVVDAWGQEPSLIRAFSEMILSAIDRGDLSGTHVVLTAHSLPMRVIDAGDDYAKQFEETARQVAARLPVSTTVCYQSQGAMAGEWLGPDLEQSLRALAESGVKRVVLSPIGFLSEHIETLYDLDVETAAFCQQLGLQLERVPAIGTHEGLIESLANAAKKSMSAAKS